MAEATALDMIMLRQRLQRGASVDQARERLATHYRSFGQDPERLVLAQCWFGGCDERVEVPYVDAARGRIYCPRHTVLAARR